MSKGAPTKIVVVISRHLGFYGLFLSSADQGPALDKNNPKKQGPARGRTEQRNAQTNTKSSRGHTETQKQQRKKRPIRDTTQGSIPRNFIPKRPSSLGRNTILFRLLLGRKPCLVVMEKSEKRRLTPPFLKKKDRELAGERKKG